ncbi:TVP38/TMEM64 family protein [Patescibacteria group bacterium]|nr:TVP38/TMEM64 family protein [Patescibacteria group bacterium]
MEKKNKVKYFLGGFWILFLLTSLYIYFFQQAIFQNEISRVFGSSLILGYIVYLIAGCLRGFSLIPITYFIVVGIIFLPPLPLYILTIVGVLVSSSCIYYFSEYMNFDHYFETRHKKQILKIKEVLSKNELPIVITWSFMPFLPTDLICYVCGSLEVDIRKFLLGVLIGEGVSCAIYIFLGKEVLNYLT